jgi:hypothetical protein
MEPTSHISATANLSKLIESAPDLWSDVLQSLKSTVVHRRIDDMARLAIEAKATFQRLKDASNSQTGDPSVAKQELIRSQMMLLAIEQFIQAYTGKNQKLSRGDRFVLGGILNFVLSAGRSLSMQYFDFAWSRLDAKAAAAASLQNAGYWSVPTKELCERLKELFHGRKVLELGAGRGLYVAGLRQSGVDILGIDDQSWAASQKHVSLARAHMQNMDAVEALNKIQPEVVLAVWPPPENQFEKHIFATNSVKLYLAVVSRHQFASGDWTSYKAVSKSKFTCTTNQSLNTLLRPAEAEQQMLIFRRV